MKNFLGMLVFVVLEFILNHVIAITLLTIALIIYLL